MMTVSVQTPVSEIETGETTQKTVGRPEKQRQTLRRQSGTFRNFQEVTKVR